jgi:hypothetical protein
MTPALPTPTPGSRLRRWTAHLTLLVACIGTVATSPPRSPPVTAEHAGPTLRLTAQSPRATRDLIVRISAEDSSSVVEGETWLEFTPRWQTTDPTRAGKPSLRVLLALEGADGPMAGDTFPLEAPGGQEPFQASYNSLPHGCRLDQPCEWKAVLEVEALGELGEDVVEVDWTAFVIAFVRDTDDMPAGFTVHISEP